MTLEECRLLAASMNLLGLLLCLVALIYCVKQEYDVEAFVGWLILLGCWSLGILVTLAILTSRDVAPGDRAGALVLHFIGTTITLACFILDFNVGAQAAKALRWLGKHFG